jgi:bifunctional non-homologous end joining protein LigD
VTLPSDITLMHPTLIARPFHREGWVYEEKYDGWRILALKSEGKVNLLSRNGRDHARRFGELARVIASFPETTLILDGEVAIFDEHLISRFEWLRHGARDSLSTPPIYMVFDVLQVGSQDLRQEPLRTRRKVLEGLVDGQRLLLPARRLSGSGLEAWREVERRGYEGLVAKDEASLYIGGRTLSWLKVKQSEYRVSSRGFQSR